jgi:hypothetical protein
MRHVYVVVGELENGIVDDYYGVCHTMERADALCLKAEEECPELHYTWYSSVEEEDD